MITGALTDGKTITNELLYSTYSSHSYFANLPDGATVILSDANGNATLVEYPLGDGYIILSGLTWEYTYDRDFVDGTSFAKEIYDDLILHAASLSSSCDHAFDMGTVVDPTCSEKGYILHVCELCGAEMKDNFTDMIEHTAGEWETVIEATTEQAGRRELHCTVCGELLSTEIIPMVNAPRLSMAGDTYLQIGAEHEFILSLTSSRGITSIELAPIFNSDIFELVSAEWLIYDTEDKMFDLETQRGTASWSSEYPTSVMMRIVLRVKAPTNAIQTIDAEVTLVTTDGETPTTVIPFEVAIAACEHTVGTYECIDGEYHVFICGCGQTFVKDHGFDNDCDSICNECGYEREVSHSYSDEFFYDNAGHWHECTSCGEHTNSTPHSYDSDKDGDCNDCGHVRFIRGDFDGDGDVDSNDAIYLLYNAMYGPESYPVDQPADLDGNEEINSDDAVYLVYHTFFGEIEYPINN